VFAPWVAAAADLLLPRDCLGCAAPGPALCPRCVAAAGPACAHRPDPVPPGFPPTWVCGPYAGTLRAAVLAYKERGRADLCGALAIALGAAVRAAVPAGQILLVPVPSVRAAARHRGGDHMRRLAGRTAAGLRAEGRPATVLALLRTVGRPRDSAGLGAQERAVNLVGAFGMVQRRGPALPGTLVIVDDVVTTGSTLASAARALRGLHRPVYAAALAGTPRRSRHVHAPVSGLGPTD